MNVYDFTVKDRAGNDVSLKKYQGKVLLIVNTATKCGFTPQYEGLEKLYKKYQDQGFEILDFPCNQFLAQAPGTNEEIAEFCKLNYGVTFTIFGKIDVNGGTAHPLYKYLKTEKPQDIENEETGKLKKVLHDLQQVFLGDSIKWNFTKFLVDREGNVIERFSPTVAPQDLEKEIEALL
ncbi:MAG: glutathione peroxidase [Caldisericia bacterium]|nr:glutathione peroxidase [Caldisericia bacterium]